MNQTILFPISECVNMSRLRQPPLFGGGGKEQIWRPVECQAATHPGNWRRGQFGHDEEGVDPVDTGESRVPFSGQSEVRSAVGGLAANKVLRG